MQCADRNVELGRIEHALVDRQAGAGAADRQSRQA
jgi:hypothetical protein